MMRRLQKVPFQSLVPLAREAMIELMRDPAVVLDQHGMVLDCNPAAVRLLSPAHGDGLAGRRITELVTEWPLVTPGETVPDVLAFEAADSVRQFEVHVSPLGETTIDGEDRTVILYVLHEVTLHAQADERREALISDLDSFAHMVAHDLKNPLAGVVGHAALLEMDLPNLTVEYIQDAVHAISRDAFRMKTIIDELLLLASVRDQHAVRLGPVNMQHVITGALGRLNYMISELKPQIHLPDADWPLAVGYGPWLEEVWTNYLSNAMKYGGSPARIDLGADPPVNGFVRFWVQDNGAGLTPDEQARLFVPFTRLQQARAEGHGLGLSIVRRIIERLGGEVGLESIPGAGSRFWFALPNFKPGAASAASTSERAASDPPA